MGEHAPRRKLPSATLVSLIYDAGGYPLSRTVAGSSDHDLIHTEAGQLEVATAAVSGIDDLTSTFGHDGRRVNRDAAGEAAPTLAGEPGLRVCRCVGAR